jgi:hypothetical protein
MRFIRLLLALAAGLLACLVTLPAASATTTTLPKIQAYKVTGWSGMVKRPAYIVLGQGGSPYAHQLQWSRWTTTSGKATGKLALWWCSPTSSCKPNVHNVTVWANTPRTHAGLSYPYFAHLIYQYVNAKGVTKRLTYWFYVLPGASVPAWNP